MSTNSLLDQLRAARQKTADKKAGMKKPYRFKQRSTLIRIFPSWREVTAEDDAPPFYHDFGQAFIKDMDGNLLAVIGDRSMTYGENDAVRDLINLARSEASSDAEREHYKQMLAKQKHLVNAAVLNDPDVNPNEAQIIEFSANQLDQIFTQMVKILEDGENPLDLDKGYDLEVEKEGSGLMTRYKFLFARRPSKAPAKVMETLTDLDAYVRSQFADTDRAINAIKSLAGHAMLPAPDNSRGDRSTSYTTSDRDDVVEAEYSAVDDAREVREPVRTNSVEVSQDEIDALLNGI